MLSQLETIYHAEQSLARLTIYDEETPDACQELLSLLEKLPASLPWINGGDLQGYGTAISELIRSIKCLTPLF